MATYNAISSTEKDEDSPVTVSLIDKLDQNPLAMFEGASGAPKLNNAALASNSIGQDRVSKSRTVFTPILSKVNPIDQTVTLSSSDCFYVLNGGIMYVHLNITLATARSRFMVDIPLACRDDDGVLCGFVTGYYQSGWDVLQSGQVFTATGNKLEIQTPWFYDGTDIDQQQITNFKGSGIMLSLD